MPTPDLPCPLHFADLLTRRRCGLLLTALALAGCGTLSTPEPAPVPPPIEPPPVVKPPPKPPRIGLALGGGAARGFAHIGVIQVLEENGIKPDLVAGTSAGSLVAALYASGKTGAELATVAQSMDEGALTDWSYPGRGLIRGDALARYVREKTGGKLIEQMRIPLGIVSAELTTGEGILFRSGDTGLAVRASSAVPAVFQPVKIGLKEYVDGGLVAPVPVRYARQMGAEVVIAVDISSPPDAVAPTDPMRMLMQTFSIMGRSINVSELREADVVLRPKLHDVASSDFGARLRAIKAGREIAQAQLAAIKASILAKTH
jgi:NTE family protein